MRPGNIGGDCFDTANSTALSSSYSPPHCNSNDHLFLFLSVVARAKSYPSRHNSSNSNGSLPVFEWTPADIVAKAVMLCANYTHHHNDIAMHNSGRGECNNRHENAERDSLQRTNSSSFPLVFHMVNPQQLSLERVMKWMQSRGIFYI